MFNETETPPTSLFTVVPNIPTESLLINSYELCSSVCTLLLDLANELDGKHRDVALAIHQLSELSVLLMSKAMDQQIPRV